MCLNSHRVVLCHSPGGASRSRAEQATYYKRSIRAGLRALH